MGISAKDVGCTVEAVLRTLTWIRSEGKVPALIEFGPIGWKMIMADLAERGDTPDAIDRLFGVPVLVTPYAGQFITFKTEPYSEARR